MAAGGVRRVVRVFGAEDALLTPISERGLPDDRKGYDRNVAAIRTQLPEEVYTATWAEGQAMTMEQAIEYALTESAKSDLTAPRPMAADLTTKPSALKQHFGGLTSREREVARLVAQGKSNRAIADELVVVVSTVEAHITHIFTKLGFSSRAQIAAWTADKGLAKS